MSLFRKQNNESDVPTHKVRDWTFIAIISVSFAMLTGSAAYIIKDITDRQNAGVKRGQLIREVQVDACEKVHTLVNVLIQDEINSRVELDNLTEEGLINQSQHERLLELSRDEITRLRTADCDVEALKISFGLEDGDAPFR